jgi:hypothetical protein
MKTILFLFLISFNLSAQTDMVLSCSHPYAGVYLFGFYGFKTNIPIENKSFVGDTVHYCPDFRLIINLSGKDYELEDYRKLNIKKKNVCKYFDEKVYYLNGCMAIKRVFFKLKKPLATK